MAPSVMSEILMIRAIEQGLGRRIQRGGGGGRAIAGECPPSTRSTHTRDSRALEYHYWSD
jgi:hypothetical protein